MTILLIAIIVIAFIFATNNDMGVVGAIVLSGVATALFGLITGTAVFATFVYTLVFIFVGANLLWVATAR